MDDPTGELRRQRDLIAAHLRWLDEQIARTQGATPPTTPVPPSPAAVPVAPIPLSAPPAGSSTTTIPAAAGTAPLPEIAMPEIDPGSVRNEVRRGCFIYVIIVTVLLAASIAVAVWIGGQ